MEISIESWWSHKYDRHLHKLAKQGTSKTLILNDDDLADLRDLINQAVPA